MMHHAKRDAYDKTSADDSITRGAMPDKSLGAHDAESKAHIIPGPAQWSIQNSAIDRPPRQRYATRESTSTGTTQS